MPKGRPALPVGQHGASDEVEVQGTLSSSGQQFRAVVSRDIIEQRRRVIDILARLDA